MRGLYAVLDLLFYGNFWIAACAFSMSALTQRLLATESIWSPANLLVFGGTLFIYGVHRSVGISRLKTFLAEKRYGVIYRYRKHIKIYAVFGLLIAGYHFFGLSSTSQWLLVLPCLLSLGYVLPVLGNKKRLRDINDIKIFLIAICWSGLTVVIPAMELSTTWSPQLIWLTTERAVFIFLITLPFDIRDLKVDAYKEVKTLPNRIGLPATQRLGLVLGGLLILMACFAFYNHWLTAPTLMVFVVCYALAMFGLYRSHPDKHDYYYTGAIDGLMLLQAIPSIILLW